MFRALLLTYSLLFSTALQTAAQQRQPAPPAGDQKAAPGAGAAAPKGSPAAVRRIGAIPDDVIIGAPEPIPYSRAFPLLDGLFQDVSAIQLTQLSLSPNAANASNLDGLIQQFQATLQYSQTLGLQNAAAAQQSAAYSASGALQTQLLNQQSQLIGLQLSAQQQVGQAQAALDALPQTATPEQKAAAQQALTLANDNLASITAQAASVKALVASSFSAPTFTAPTPSPISFPTPVPFPSPPALSTNNGTSSGPSFPASKQMENQVFLLWERLAQLVNTIAQSDHPNGISLVKFNTGITGGKGRRKRQLLSTQYSMTCSNQAAGAPLVMDLFPRTAAVNITDMKYRDSSFGLGALLSFFGVGSNVAYNREHLRITQALGESAYITGFGIETSSFGWVFSPALGEDVIAPGDRTTFALVAAPENCQDVHIHLVNAAWDKAPVTTYAAWDGYAAGDASDRTPMITDLKTWTADPSPGISCGDKCVERVAYVPAEFDPSSASTGAVSIDIKLATTLDREQTVSANGLIMKRARDNFGRATATGGAGGLLQATALDPGTWIPVSSKELILNLNPALFTRRFPSILLTSPDGTIDVTGQISDKTGLEVGGRLYNCPPQKNIKCADVLPAVGRPKAVAKHFAVARWVVPDPLAAGKLLVDHFIFTLPEVTAPAASSTASTAIPAVQVVTDSRTQPWSGDAEVVAFQGDKFYPLQCQPRGERLLCDPGGLKLDQKTDFEIFDPDFNGAAVKGSGVWTGCTALCADPLVWEMSPPRWVPEKDEWVFRLSMVNVTDGQTAVFLGTGFNGRVNCSSPAQPCGVEIELPKKGFNLITDSMQLQVQDSNGNVGSPTVIGNIRAAITPILTDISDDQTHFTGQNLVFTQMQVGSARKLIDLTCVAAIDCSVLGAGFGEKDEGYLYFVDPDARARVPLMIMSDKGKQVVPPHKQKKGGDENSSSGAKPVPSPQPASPPSQKNPETRLYSIKEQ